MRALFRSAPVICLITLAACDTIDTDFERAAVGGALGCAAGETVVEGRCVEGAIIGAGVGVLLD